MKDVDHVIQAKERVSVMINPAQAFKYQQVCWLAGGGSNTALRDIASCMT
jgi:hypothetical protein